MIKSLIWLTLILLPLVSVLEGRLLGSRKPINVSDENVVAIAKYAISEHNKQSKANLVFEKVIQGTEQVVSGKKYDLIISAKNGGGATKNYHAVVLERLWDHPSMMLESFETV